MAVKATLQFNPSLYASASQSCHSTACNLKLIELSPVFKFGFDQQKRVSLNETLHTSVNVADVNENADLREFPSPASKS